jgi:hypothetical protein
MENQRCEHCGKVIQGKAIELELSVDNGRYYAQGKFPKGHESQGAFVFGERCAKENVVRWGRLSINCKETATEQRLFELLNMYRELKDRLLTKDKTIAEWVFDACSYDIEGIDSEMDAHIDDDGDMVYPDSKHNQDLIEHMEEQVKALRKLIEGASRLSFMFG